jgi:toxin YoeB
LKIVFSETAWDDYQFWLAKRGTELTRLNELIRACTRTPFKGIGKPEPLAGNLKAWWSRRITAEHRLVYRVRGTGAEQVLEIAACRFHYDR